MEKCAKGIPPIRIPKLSKKLQDKEGTKKLYTKLINGGMIGNSIYIGRSFNGLIQEVK